MEVPLVIDAAGNTPAVKTEKNPHRAIAMGIYKGRIYK